MAKLPVLTYNLSDLDAERDTQTLWCKLARLTPDERLEITRLVDEKHGAEGPKPQS
jgi:hypothetical protein